MDVRLVIATGRKAGSVLKLQTSKVLIGRADDCHLRLRSKEISRHHAILLIEPDSVAVRDLESTAGTLVNEHYTDGRTPLRHGDRLRFGRVEFDVRIGSPSVKKTAAVEPPKQAPAKTKASPSDVDIFGLLGEELPGAKSLEQSIDEAGGVDRETTKIYFDANVLGIDRAHNIFYPQRFREGTEVEICDGVVLSVTGTAGSAIGSRLQLLLTVEKGFESKERIDHLITKLCGRLHNNIAKLRIGQRKILIPRGVDRAMMEGTLKGEILSHIRQRPA